MTTFLSPKIDGVLGGALLTMVPLVLTGSYQSALRGDVQAAAVLALGGVAAISGVSKLRSAWEASRVDAVVGAALASGAVCKALYYLPVLDSLK